jgi:hypothetical protein
LNYLSSSCSRKEAIRLTIDPDFRKKKKKAGKEEGISWASSRFSKIILPTDPSRGQHH